MAVSSVRDKSPKFDESVHIAAGFSYWKFKNYRFQPENGNLPQRWHALPLLLGGSQFPQRSSKEWQTSNVWTIGDQFLHSEGNNVDRMLLRSRAAVALLGVIVCLTVFGWAGGLVSLTLCGFSPDTSGAWAAGESRYMRRPCSSHYLHGSCGRR